MSRWDSLSRRWRRSVRAGAIATLLGLASLAVTFPSFAAEQKFQLRLGATAKKKLNKQFSLKLTPEIRTAGLNPDRYLLSIEGRYKPIRYFATEVVWRSDLVEQGTELGYGHRPGAALIGLLPMKDFDVEARFFYTYDFGHLRPSRHRFRYRLALAYDVPDVPLDLEASMEAFEQLETRGFYKMRYGVQGTYRFYKSKKLDQYARVGYMLDYFLDAPVNLHIVELSYRLKF